MDYVLLIIFLGLYYIRPQEWSAISALRPVQLLAGLAILSLLTRDKGIKKSDLLGTPVDWLVSAYFAWTVFASSVPRSTFRDILPLILFYFLGKLALDTIPKMQKFLWWWGMFVVTLAGLAVASKFGFDPFNSLRITDGPMKGRLVLNLSLFNNPNSLGHGVVPAIPLLYYTVFWRKLFSKGLIVLLVIPLACIYLTVSKGAFISAAITMLATLTFGRPKPVQIAIGALALIFGTTLLYALPRMNELNSKKGDDAIQGRVAAFRFGLSQMERLTYGHGLGNFSQQFFKYGPTQKVKTVRSVNGKTVVVYKQEHYYKAPHSAYNQNGADLGYMGLFLFIGVLYSCMRTLIQARTANPDEEMVRRALFGIVVSYTVSSWMVDFCYRPTFFLFAAAVSALHRHLLPEVKKEEEEEGYRPAIPSPTFGHPVLAGAGISQANATVAPQPAVLVKPEDTGMHSEEDDDDDRDEDDPKPRRGYITWLQYGLVDLVANYLCTAAIIQLWRYAIRTM